MRITMIGLIIKYYTPDLNIAHFLYYHLFRSITQSLTIYFNQYASKQI
jgi:hypothetical protein